LTYIIKIDPFRKACADRSLELRGKKFFFDLIEKVTRKKERSKSFSTLPDLLFFFPFLFFKLFFLFFLLVEFLMVGVACI